MLKKLSRYLLLLSFGTTLPAMSAMIHAPGDTVDFYYDDATLFGSANVIGNSIYFLPTNFKAESTNGAGTHTAHQTINITITARPGNVIESIAMLESGDYLLSGSGASASANGMLAITSNTKLNGFFPFRETQLFTAGSLSDTGGLLQEWSANTDIDLGLIAGWENDTDVTVTAENILSATTLNNAEQAFIEKKFLGIGLIVNPDTPTVPIPAAAWLFGSGLLAIAGLARRQRKV
jgi:hypothetical protein